MKRSTERCWRCRPPRAMCWMRCNCALQNLNQFARTSSYVAHNWNIDEFWFQKHLFSIVLLNNCTAMAQCEFSHAVFFMVWIDFRNKSRFNSWECITFDKRSMLCFCAEALNKLNRLNGELCLKYSIHLMVFEKSIETRNSSTFFTWYDTRMAVVLNGRPFRLCSPASTSGWLV